MNCVKVCYNLQKEFIFFKNDEELSVENFIQKCIGIFKINSDVPLVFQFFDQNGFRLRKEHFVDLILHFNKSSSFTIHMTCGTEQRDEDIMTQFELESFLQQRGAGPILSGIALNGNITEKDRRKIINLTFEFLTAKFKTIKQTHKANAAKMLASIFPSLNENLIYNTKDGGWLGKKIKNSKSSKKETTSIPLVLEHNENTNDNQTMEEDMNYLKNVVVSPENVQSIQAALKRTIIKRKEIIKMPDIDYLQEFPFMFTNPELILFDFEETFPNSNSTQLVENWSEYSIKFRDILQKSYETNIYTIWQTNIEDLLVLLKLFPAKSNGRNTTANITSFNKAISKLVVFCNTGKPPQSLVNKKNIYPYIIACGETSKEISHFYIAIEENLINVPLEYAPVQVLDLLFKIHQIFQIEYEPNIKPLMNFLSFFFYKIKEKKFNPSLQMQNVFGKLNLPIQNRH